MEDVFCAHLAGVRQGDVPKMLKCNEEGMPYIVQTMDIDDPNWIKVGIYNGKHVAKRISMKDKIHDGRTLVIPYSSKYGSYTGYCEAKKEERCVVEFQFLWECFREQREEIHKRLEKYYELHWDGLKPMIH
jgi:hypothetical protein